MTFLRSASSLSVKTRHYYLLTGQIFIRKSIISEKRVFCINSKINWPNLSRLVSRATMKYRSNCNESALSKPVPNSIYQLQISRAEIGWLHDNTAYSYVSCCIHYCNLVAGMSKILVGSGDKLNYI